MRHPHTSVKSTASMRSTQSGFTIIELLIAMLIFSLVMVLITVGVLTFTKTYIKGVNQSKTQTVARTIVESLTQAIQFSGGAVNPDYAALPNKSDGFCVGDKRYSFLLGKQLVNGPKNPSQTNHALKVDESGSCGGSNPQDMTINPTDPGSPVGLELLGPGMRVSDLRIEQIGLTSNYRVIVRIVYGDNDLLHSPGNKPEGAEADDATCILGISGSHFCAVSELSTIVNKRLNQTP